MQLHPWFVYDEDDAYDTTYASFYFKMNLDEIHASVTTLGGPADDIVRAMRMHACEPVNMRKRWDEALDAMRNH
jgi:uncharacterized protein (DUF2461 family)